MRKCLAQVNRLGSNNLDRAPLMNCLSQEMKDEENPQQLSRTWAALYVANQVRVLKCFPLPSLHGADSVVMTVQPNILQPQHPQARQIARPANSGITAPGPPSPPPPPPTVPSLALRNGDSSRQGRAVSDGHACACVSAGLLRQ